MATLHRRRYREQLAGKSYTQADWQAALAKYGGKCLKCGATQDITVDHIIPIARGGDNTITNLQPLCRKCNREKSDRVADYRGDEQMAALLMEKRWRIALDGLGHKLDEPERELSEYEQTFLASLVTPSQNQTVISTVASWNRVFDWLEENLTDVPQLLSWVMTLQLRDFVARNREALLLSTMGDIQADVAEKIEEVTAQLKHLLPSATTLLARTRRVQDAYLTEADIVLEDRNTQERVRKEMSAAREAIYQELLARWRNQHPGEEPDEEEIDELSRRAGAAYERQARRKVDAAPLRISHRYFDP